MIKITNHSTIQIYNFDTYKYLKIYLNNRIRILIDIFCDTFHLSSRYHNSYNHNSSHLHVVLYRRRYTQSTWFYRVFTFKNIIDQLNDIIITLKCALRSYDEFFCCYLSADSEVTVTDCVPSSPHPPLAPSIR